MRLETLFSAVLVALVVSLSSGCASVTGTTNQSVSVQTMEAGNVKELPGALCELSNSKGKWFVTTPGSTMITRSNDDMQVVCKKEGHDAGHAAVVSETKGSMFGNILLGGGIGAIIDHNTGAAYEYPAFFKVVMGATTKIEPPKPAPVQPAPDVAAAPGAPPRGTPAPSAPALTPSGPIPIAAQPATQSKEDRLKELKRLYDNGLITKEVYAEEQRKVMDSR